MAHVFLGLDAHLHTALHSEFSPKPTPPISPAVANVISFTIQYLVVYFFVNIIKSHAQLTNKANPRWLRLVENTTRTVQFCPMLGILYIGVRLRAITMDPLGAPPVWAQTWMHVCSMAVIGDLVLILIKYFVIDENAGLKGLYHALLSFGNILIYALLYAGIVFIILAFFAMEKPPVPTGGDTGPVAGAIPVIVPPPPITTTTTTTTLAGTEEPEAQTDAVGLELEEEPWTPPVPPALQSMISLAIQYFVVYFVAQSIALFNQYFNNGKKSALERILDEGRESCKFCPILSVLFIGARMRALELDPEGAPQKWAQAFFILATQCVMAQTVLQLFLPFFTGAWNAKTDEEGNMSARGGRAGTMAFLISFTRYVILTGIYCSTAAVCCSVVIIRAPKGKTTFPISSAMSCVMILTVLFTVMYFLLSAVKSYTEIFLDIGVQTTRAERVLVAAHPALEYIPISCVLYIAVRMRALQIHPSGAPQPWAQDMMYASTYCIMLMTVVCLIIPFCTYELEDAESVALTDHDANTADARSREARSLSPNAKMFTGIKFLILACYYASTILLIFSAFTISVGKFF